MFMCKQCGEQFEDSGLAFTLMPENRVSHPAADMYLLKFCSKKHVQDFLDQIRNQHQLFILTKVGKGGGKTFDAASPIDLLLLVGSTRAS